MRPRATTRARARDGGPACDEAIAQYEEAIRLDPEYPLPHVSLGLVLADRGRIDEAIAHYRAAIALDPGATRPTTTSPSSRSSATARPTKAIAASPRGHPPSTRRRARALQPGRGPARARESGRGGRGVPRGRAARPVDSRGPRRPRRCAVAARRPCGGAAGLPARLELRPDWTDVDARGPCARRHADVRRLNGGWRARSASAARSRARMGPGARGMIVDLARVGSRGGARAFRLRGDLAVPVRRHRRSAGRELAALVRAEFGDAGGAWDVLASRERAQARASERARMGPATLAVIEALETPAFPAAPRTAHRRRGPPRRSASRRRRTARERARRLSERAHRLPRPHARANVGARAQSARVPERGMAARARRVSRALGRAGRALRAAHRAPLQPGRPVPDLARLVPRRHAA